MFLDLFSENVFGLVFRKRFLGRVLSNLFETVKMHRGKVRKKKISELMLSGNIYRIFDQSGFFVGISEAKNRVAL